MPIDTASPDELLTEPLPPDPEPGTPERLVRGTCKVCGQPSKSKRSYYCAEHVQKPGPQQGTKPKPDKPPRSAPDSRAAKPGLHAELVASFKTFGAVWLMTGPRIAPGDMPYLLPDVPPSMLETIVHPGVALANQADTLATSLIQATAGSARMTKWLEAAAQPSGVLAVGVAVTPVVASAKLWYSVVVPNYRQAVQAQVAQAQAAAAAAGQQEGAAANGNAA